MSMETALTDLQGRPIEWLGSPERQPWGGLLSHFKDPDGNVLTLVQYP
jgi:Glyoxalase/Bleomycin resistance protein/Dioxygenase superfamily